MLDGCEGKLVINVVIKRQFDFAWETKYREITTWLERKTGNYCGKCAKITPRITRAAKALT